MPKTTILTDIEGTTSSISFVKDVLFPYSRVHLREFVAQHGSDDAVRAALDAVASECGSAGASDDALVDELLRWIDEDRKATPLKALQGMIWAAGYSQGDFVAHVYADAAAALRRWHAAGHVLYVYSSGSVQAQKLFFAHTAYGDLTPLFSGYFDTEVGGKRERASYERIAAQIGQPVGDIVFLSDIEQEIDAARAAGMATAWVRRDASAATVAAAGPGVVRDFEQIEIPGP